MPRGEHRTSILLSREENEQVFALIGPKCQSLATAVVQLFTTEGPGHSEWKKKDTGVLCLIKDNGRRSYFFRIYCLYRKSMIWEHEVYLQIEYKSPRPYLHTFEAEEYMTAFNFASEEEAKILRNVLIDRIETRKQRRQERRQRSMMSVRSNSGGATTLPRHNGVLHAPTPPPPPPAAPTPAPAPLTAPLTAPLAPKQSFTSSYTLKASKKPKGRKLTKADISAPHNFKHVSHIGWNANTGFDVETLPDDDEMRSFFMKAGVSESQLQDQDTRQFIYDFIQKNGGVDAVKEELHETKKPWKALPAGGYNDSSSPAPPVPSRSPAPPLPTSQPPLPPSRAPPPPPAPPARVVPPPPPPSLSAPRNPPPRPPQPPSSAPPSVPPPPPPMGSAPPPPPAPPAPPPPPAPPAAPPPPPMPAPADSAVPEDARAALLESIRSGNKTLKRVEPSVAPAPKVDDSRSNLLSEIRQGTQLRSVALRATKASPPRSMPMPDGLAGALARALDKRSRALRSSDDEDDDTTSDGEWTD